MQLKKNPKPTNPQVPANSRYPSQSGWGQRDGAGAGWSQAAEEGAGTWERKCKPVRLSCIYFSLCHADVKRTVIYSGISVILGILEIFAVSQGIVGIRGVFSNKFLAMSKKGKLHASVSNPPPPLTSMCGVFLKTVTPPKCRHSGTGATRHRGDRWSRSPRAHLPARGFKV